MSTIIPSQTPNPPQPQVHPILAARAVQADHVRGQWGVRYARFEHRDWNGFTRARRTHHHAWMRRAFVDASGGFVIHRWDCEGKQLPSYVRPDYPVCTWHGRRSVRQRGDKQLCGVCGKTAQQVHPGIQGRHRTQRQG
jgi:hypothetical protein